MRSEGGKILLWGCLTYHGLGNASWIPGRLNSVSYLDILESYIIQSQEWTGLFGSKFIFQQDNDKTHTSKLAKRFFRKNNIAVMKWPANSPDLNIMENIWAYMKKHLDEYEEESKEKGE